MINFNEVRIRNFLSFGDRVTTVNFKDLGSVLVSGTNGNGKSSLYECFTFVLFGKTYREVKKASVVNFKNKGDCLVELDLTVSGVPYTIRRGQKPNIFEIIKDSVLLNQDSSSRDYQKFLEDKILHMSFNTFCQTVLISKTGFTPFFSLTTSERRKFVEDLLSLSIFSQMNILNKEDLYLRKREHDVIKNDVNLAKAKLDQTIQHIKNLTEAEEQRKNRDSSLCVQQVQEKEELIRLTKLEFEKIEMNHSRVSEFHSSDTTDYLGKVNSFNSIVIKGELRISQIKNDIQKLKEGDETCHSCGQEINQEYRDSRLSSLTVDLEKIERLVVDANGKMADYQDKYQRWKKTSEDLEVFSKKMRELQKIIGTHESSIKKLNDDMNRVHDSESELIVQEKERATSLLNQYKDLVSSRDSSKVSIDRLDFINDVLKDTGIKASIIRQYLPVINSTVNKFLMKFGFNVRMEIDETFSEKIFVNGFHELSYNNYSEGEKLRIDLSLILTWRLLTKIQKNADTNLLILDEIITTSLDSDGIENFFDIIKEQGDLSLVVVAHQLDKYAGFFDSEMNVSKESGFSTITIR